MPAAAFLHNRLCQGRHAYRGEYAHSRPIPRHIRGLRRKSEEELFEKIIDYMTIADSPEFAERYMRKCRKNPIRICYGAETKELISNKKWDIAIASSKEVDLQALAKNGLIYYEEFGYRDPSYRQCLIPEALAAELPNQSKPWAYRIYHFDHNAQTNDTTLLIVNERTKNVEYLVPEAIMDARPANMVRELEGIARAKFWTADALIERQADWDAAVLDIRVPNERFPEELRRLDEAGLLCDLSQNSYLASRTDVEFESGYRRMPKGIFSADGRMVAVPYRPYYTYETDDEEHLLIVNQKSAYREKALDYGELLVKINDAYYADRKRITLEEVRKW